MRRITEVLQNPPILKFSYGKEVGSWQLQAELLRLFVTIHSRFDGTTNKAEL